MNNKALKKQVVILISGRGSNMEAIINANIPEINISAVISNKADAKGLITAQNAGIQTAVLDHKNFENRLAFDQALIELIDSFNADLVVLAGFMRILTPEFTQYYQNRLINIHPSLLPSFTGLHTHQRAIDEGVKFHGCSVHFVTAELDHGPIILQAVVPVLDDDNEDALSSRVLVEEHKIYSKAIQLFAQNKLDIVGNRVLIKSS